MLLVRFALIYAKSAFTTTKQGLMGRSNIFTKLLLQSFLLAMAAIVSASCARLRAGYDTYKAVGVVDAVSGAAEPALRIKTSSEPPVALETSAADCCSFFGSEMSVSTILMF